jgi:hypothetical protein
MAAKKMLPPGEIQNLLGDDYEEFRLRIGFRIQAGQVVMQFSDDIERVRMGADRLGNAGSAPSKPAGSGATPPKSRRKQPIK